MKNDLQSTRWSNLKPEMFHISERKSCFEKVFIFLSEKPQTFKLSHSSGMMLHMDEDFLLN